MVNSGALGELDVASAHPRALLLFISLGTG